MGNSDTAKSGPQLRISIAMATYNGARFLGEQLKSLADQTVRPIELVVSDDGSADGTIAIVQDFAAKAPFPVKIVQGPCRLNYRLNFRRASQQCSGDLIAFCDQDDVWQSDKLHRMLQAFSDPETLLAYHNATVGTRLLYIADKERAALKEKSMMPFKSPNGLLMVFRAELRRFDDLWDMTVDQNEGDVILAHDQWYFFLARALDGVRFVDKPLVEYRQHTNNTLGLILPSNFRERLAQRLTHYGNTDEWAAKSASSRARVLEAMYEREGNPRLRHLAELYRSLARRRERRAAIYCDTAASRRAAALVRCVVVGDYSGCAWSFRRSSILRDVWSGVTRGKCADPTRCVRPGMSIQDKGRFEVN